MEGVRVPPTTQTGRLVLFPLMGRLEGPSVRQATVGGEAPGANASQGGRMDLEAVELRLETVVRQRQRVSPQVGDDRPAEGGSVSVNPLRTTGLPGENEGKIPPMHSLQMLSERRLAIHPPSRSGGGGAAQGTLVILAGNVFWGNVQVLTAQSVLAAY